MTGAGYEYVLNGSLYGLSTPSSMNASGQVAGTSSRFNTSGSSLGSDSWFSSAAGTQAIGLAGDTYEYSYTGTGGGTYRSSAIEALNAAGQVMGSSRRYSATGVDLGRELWLASGGTTSQIGLVGADYQYWKSGGGFYRYSMDVGLNPSGQAIGYTYRYSASGTYLGNDAWYTTPDGSAHLIGYTGPGYSFNHSSGRIHRLSSVNSQNASGQIFGTSGRYNSAGASLGGDTWIATATSITSVGLDGAGYEYTYTGTGGGTHHYSVASLAINAGGQVAGYTFRYNTSGTLLGKDAWQATTSGTQRIGLNGDGYEYNFTGTGGGVYRSSEATAQNAAGQVLGYSARYSVSGTALGQDAWYANGSTTQRIGLTGSGYEYPLGGGSYRSSTAVAQNEAGRAIGYSNRYNTAGKAQGRDAWLTAGTTTTRIGLTGSGYESGYTGTGGGSYRYSEAVAQNPAGKVVGISKLYSGTYSTGDPTAMGQDAWMADDTGTRRISPTGSGYEYTDSFGVAHRNSGVSSVNAAGQAIGIANRYAANGSGLGFAGWFYDDATQMTTLLEFSYRSTDNYSNTRPILLTDSGVVLGRYTRYDGAASTGVFAFWWTPDDGIHDLGALPDGGASLEDWKSLQEVYTSSVPGTVGTAANGLPQYILGSGELAGHAGGANVFLLSAVPEPCVTMVGLSVAMTLLPRRPRREHNCISPAT